MDERDPCIEIRNAKKHQDCSVAYCTNDAVMQINSKPLCSTHSQEAMEEYLQKEVV